MAIATEKDLCAGCIHAVLNGVACDWPSQFCPRSELLSGKQSQASGYVVRNLTLLAAQGEFDVIRSNN